MHPEVKRYLSVAVGCLTAAAAVNLFFVPHHLLSGGVSGLAMIFYFLFDWPIGLVGALMNIPLFFAAHRLMDRSYVLNALFGLSVFSVAIDATHFLSGLHVMDDVLLSAIYGGVISGTGAGIMYRVNGSSGGLDIVGSILRKYYGLNIGAVSFMINCLLMIAGAAMFGLKPAMYTLLSMYVTSRVADAVTAGFNRKKSILIISERYEEIAAAIIDEVGRGATFLYGEGAYTHLQKRVLYVVITLTQIGRVKAIVERHDPHAFMIVQDANEVLGKGFNLPLYPSDDQQAKS